MGRSKEVRKGSTMDTGTQCDGSGDVVMVMGWKWWWEWDGSGGGRAVRGGSGT